MYGSLFVLLVFCSPLSEKLRSRIVLNKTSRGCKTQSESYFIIAFVLIEFGSDFKFLRWSKEINLHK